jgi:hypothetical protein
LLLFENEGSLYHDGGFEMLTTLIQYCCPYSVSNAFTSLLSLFNDFQGKGELIIEYQARFDGLTIKLSLRKVALPLILLVVFFLWGLHGCYSDIVEQFCSCFKWIESTSIDSFVSNVSYHDKFTLGDSKKGKQAASSSSGMRVPAAIAANTNQQG